MHKKISPVVIGLIGTAGMALLYYGLLTLTTGDALHPFIFFVEKWQLLTPLFLTFGIQMYFWQRLQIVAHEHSLAMTGAATGSNAVAMAACCAHHLADILPILGVAGIASTLTVYQDWFISLGVLINLVSTGYFIWKIRQYRTMTCHIHSPHAS